MQSVPPKWLFIVNPASGGWKVERHWPRIESFLLKHHLSFEAVITARRGHATHIAAQAIKNGYRHIVAVGGDGTANEVVNGIISQVTTAPQNITFAMLPVGTGNDWVRTWNIPKQWTAWLRMLNTGNTTRQDVGVVSYTADGLMQQRYFINVAGLAYDAFVVRYIESRKKKIRSRFTYLWMLLKCLFKYELTPAKLEYETARKVDYFYTINVGICRYSGGGMQIVPHAIPDNGLLALTYVGQLSKLQIILNTWRFYTGSLDKYPPVFTTQTSSLRVKPFIGSEVLLEVDGEFLGTAPCEFSILKKVLKITVP